MNTTEEAQRRINSQLSEDREATVKGVPKDMKDEITWAYAKDGFEVTTTHREDGTYDLTVKEDSSSVSSRKSRLTKKEKEDILENEASIFSRNQVELYETGTENRQSSVVKELWQRASEATKGELGSVVPEDPSVDLVLLSDGHTVAEAPLMRFEELPIEKELGLTQALLETSPDVQLSPRIEICVALMRLALGESFFSVTDDYPEHEDVLAKPRNGTVTSDSDFSDEEIRGLARKIYNEGVAGKVGILIEDGEIEVLKDVQSDEDARQRLTEKLNSIERRSPIFEIQINRRESELRFRFPYLALSGSDCIALLLVNPKTFFGCHEITEQRFVISDSPLFVRVMETELKKQYK